MLHDSGVILRQRHGFSPQRFQLGAEFIYRRELHEYGIGRNEPILKACRGPALRLAVGQAIGRWLVVPGNGKAWRATSIGPEVRLA